MCVMETELACGFCKERYSCNSEAVSEAEINTKAHGQGVSLLGLDLLHLLPWSEISVRGWWHE